MLQKRTCSYSLVLFVVFSIACNNKKIEKKKGYHHIIIFIWGMSPYPNKRICIFHWNVKLKSVFYRCTNCLAYSVLFCIVVTTNRGLSCTVYLLTGQSYRWESVKTMLKYSGKENLNTSGPQCQSCWSFVSFRVREIFSRINCWFSLKCISGQASWDKMYPTNA